MYYALSWFITASLLALWSLTTWALHAVAVWSISHLQAFPGASSGAGPLSLPDWLAPWIPPELEQTMRQWMQGLGPVMDTILQAAPALADGLTMVTWAVWGLGCVLLVLLGIGLHLLITLWRRHGGGSKPSQASG